MPREKWILAFSSVVALGLGAAEVQAQVPAPRGAGVGLRQALTAPAESVPTRYTRSAAMPPEDATPTKNYYDELFAGESATSENATDGLESPFSPEEATPAAATTPVAPASGTRGRLTVLPATRSTSVPRPASAPAAATRGRPVAKARTPVAAQMPRTAIVEDDAETNRIVPAGVVASADEQGRVRQATYDRAAGAPDRGFIQQISGSDRGAAPFPESAPFSSRATGPQTGSVSVEWVKKSEINVGQECLLELQVKNSGSSPASGVQVEALFPSTVRLTMAEPKPTSTEDRIQWTFDTIAPGATSKVSVKLIPSRRGELTPSAIVRFSTATVASFKVEEPLLKVAIKGPAEVMLGDPATQLVTISNPGTGIATDVKIEAHLSEGLEHTGGKQLVMDVGAINAGESRQIRLGLLTVGGGVQTLTVTATSSSDASNVATASVNVIAPSLKLAVDGPGLRYKGRTARYQLTVTNDGAVANNNVRITQKVAEGFQFVSADKSGKFDAGQRTIQWFVGRLDAGQAVTVACELDPTALGDFAHQATCLSDAGVKTEANITTRVEGTSALTIEVVDLDDPVEVGVETAYEIRVKNAGSKAATNLQLSCELPEGVQLLKVEGPVQARNVPGGLQFQPVAQLAAGTQAIFRVHVKGSVEGNHRLRASLTSDAVDEPLQREEQTKFYLDTVRQPE